MAENAFLLENNSVKIFKFNHNILWHNNQWCSGRGMPFPHLLSEHGGMLIHPPYRPAKK